jgi:hypothetical protein
MRASYVALPHQLTSRRWMVFNRIRCQPVACDLSPEQAQTLADAFNIAATGELRTSPAPPRQAG